MLLISLVSGFATLHNHLENELLATALALSSLIDMLRNVSSAILVKSLPPQSDLLEYNSVKGVGNLFVKLKSSGNNSHGKSESCAST